MKRKMLIGAVVLMISACITAQNANQSRTGNRNQEQREARVQKPAPENKGQLMKQQKHARNEARKAEKQQQKDLKRQQRKLRKQQKSLEKQQAEIRGGKSTGMEKAAPRAKGVRKPAPEGRPGNVPGGKGQGRK